MVLAGLCFSLNLVKLALYLVSYFVASGYDRQKKKKTKLVWAGLLVGFIRGFVHFWAGEASR